ncbi:MAG: hypothetical protein HY960_01470 [Ignavibacteriae bacterium]|nr:hypothetical protein [Ignavibacteriota bacterium]
MDLNKWMNEVEVAYKNLGKSLSPKHKEILLSNVPDKSTAESADICLETLDALLRYFWVKVNTKKTFGDKNSITKRFGKTLEQNYGVSEGPFLDLAYTYWTFKLESHDLRDDYAQLTISQIIFKIEVMLASIFFPTPGPHTYPDDKRKMHQRDMCRDFASEFDIERCIAQSPYFRSTATKSGGCLSIAIFFIIFGLSISYIFVN